MRGRQPLIITAEVKYIKYSSLGSVSLSQPEKYLHSNFKLQYTSSSNFHLSAMLSYYFDNIPGDQRLPHDYAPSRPVSAQKLTELGINHWSISVEGHEARLNDIAKERDYKNRDVINVSKEGMGDVSLVPRFGDM